MRIRVSRNPNEANRVDPVLRRARSAAALSELWKVLHVPRRTGGQPLQREERIKVRRRWDALRHPSLAPKMGRRGTKGSKFGRSGLEVHKGRVENKDKKPKKFVGNIHKKAKTVTFDPASRQEFISGFRKRTQ